MPARLHKNLLIFGLLTVLGFAAGPARAHHLMRSHTLDCSPNFPCPPAIQPRMNFWISVFGEWDKHTAVLHDSKEPQRVYAVVKNRHGCSVSRKRLRRERAKAKKTLLSVADKIQDGKPLADEYEVHLAALFYPHRDAEEIRAAAETIRCQGGVSHSFLAGLSRYHGYRPMINQVLAENHLPLEIAYLPFVESSYNPDAYSRVGAAGIWQFMPKTARVFGLKLNATLDERLDPEAATRAAAEYLTLADRLLSKTARRIKKKNGDKKELNRAQINPFLVTSYNYGIGGMRRAMRENGLDYMAVLERYKSPSFRIAVKNFYASFLAARHLAIKADGNWNIAPRGGVYQSVVLQRPVSIERIMSVFGLGEAQLRPLNLALTNFVWRGWRTVPAGYRLRLPRKDDRWQSERAQLARFGSQELISGGDHYIVRSGDTACGVARALEVNCSELLAANQIGLSGLIQPGQKLFIPRKPAARASSRGKLPVFAGDYVVRRGDSACRIAKRFGVGCQALIRHNNLGADATILVGESLSIPDARPPDAPPSLNADNLYITRRGDSACGVAARFGVNCRALLRLNGLLGSAIIHPGQKLQIPGLVVPATNRTARQLAEAAVVTATPPQNRAAPAAADINTAAGDFYEEFDFDFVVDRADAPEVDVVASATLLNILDTLPDLGISITDAAGIPEYAVRVEAEETLGHFTDWLGINGSGELRKLNKLPGNRSIDIGRRLVLPIRNAEMAERFEKRRSDYHQVLGESLKDHYDLVGVEAYTARRGDSAGKLAQRHGFPVWLFYRLNPSLRNGELKPGQSLTLPRLKAKT
ncbi:MAG: LysM peptidoglycan-binding domain-containing protein [Gammaproteobacteria bacterium]